jgi:hypothetical protein
MNRRFWRQPASAAVVVLVSHLAFDGPARAQGDASGTALEELRRGVSLRKEGKYADAIPVLTDSFHLVPNVKALLNLADCEEHAGRFVDAEQHWTLARDLAESQSNVAIRNEAVARLEALEPRMPRLAITLAAGAPASSRVVRDGVALPAGLLGVALPVDAGRHVVEVEADGREKAVVEMSLSERDHQRVEVAPGPESPPPKSQPPAHRDDAPPEPVRAPATSAPDLAPPPNEVGPDLRHGQGLVFYAGIGAAGLGVASLVLGTVEGVMAQSQHGDAVAKCGDDCTKSPSAQELQRDATSAASTSTVAFVAGAALIASGVALVLVTNLGERPSAKPHPTTALALSPQVTRGGGGVSLALGW